MKLVAGWILISAAIAHAGPAFEEYGGGEPPRPRQHLVAMACEIAVELRGAVATVETRERIANGGSTALAAREDVALPAGAQLIGAALVVDGATVPAIGVPAQFSTTTVDARSVLGPDPLVVTAVSTGGAPRYRAILQPIEPGHEVTLITRYAAVAALGAGGLHLVLPGRAGDADCRGTLRATSGPGARITGIRIAGADAGPRTAAFRLGDAPAAIDVALDVAGADPIVWTQTEGLGAGWSATLVTVVAPQRRAPTGPGRALFVIDGSRSMELVGRPRVVQVMRAVAAALPGGTEVEAIVYDRTAARVLGGFRPATADTLAALEAGVRGHPAGNGSDLAAAFALAHTALTGARGAALVVVISDGVLGDADGGALAQALDGQATTLDVHAIVLDPAYTRSPGRDAIRAPIDRYGGSLVEIGLDELDRSLASADDWLRPAARELALGPVAIPDEARAGGGFTRTFLHREAAPVLALTGHGEAGFRVAARPAPAAPIAQLALADATAEAIAGPDPSTAALATARATLARARALHPAADHDHAFAALAHTGTVAASRRAMILGGGPYERTIALADPPAPPAIAATATAGPAPSAIDKLTLERLFRDQLAPRAYACYQRALGRSPRLLGTATFELHIGRGEVSQVTVAGLGDAAFDACLVDAGYALQPPLPDFAVNADDQTVAHYPLSFAVRDDHPLVMAGDADSSSPLDIDAIQGGVPERRRPIHVDASTPLGGLPRQR
jgi:VWA domain-containing protein